MLRLGRGFRGVTPRVDDALSVVALRLLTGLAAHHRHAWRPRGAALPRLLCRLSSAGTTGVYRYPRHPAIATVRLRPAGGLLCRLPRDQAGHRSGRRGGGVQAGFEAQRTRLQRDTVIWRGELKGLAHAKAHLQDVRVQPQLVAFGHGHRGTPRRRRWRLMTTWL